MNKQTPDEAVKVVAEYVLSGISKPIGMSECQFTQSLPEQLKTSLPSIEQLETEFKQDIEGLGYGE